ncbi:MAG TPA: DUF748 domain-containing protein, partial [Opitutaceae bacterium]|nr:DUF748 domain-containing protein [Opitutaceae bacterium]
RRDKDGTINLLSLLQPSADTATPADPADSSAGGDNSAAPPAGNPGAAARPALGLTVGELAIREFAVEFEDLGPETPARLGAERVHLSLKEFTLAEGAKMPLQLTLDWLPAGALRADGTVSLRPLEADLKLEVDGLALPPLSPYLEERVNAKLATGLVSLGGRATLASREAGPPGATFTGQSWLERFSFVEGAEAREIGGFSDLVMSGVEVATGPRLTARVADVNLTAPHAAIVVDPDRRMNLASLRKRAPSPAADQAAVASVVFAPPAPAEDRSPALEAGRVVVSGGRVTFRDDSVQPRVEFALAEVGGTVTALSSANPGRGEIDLRAKVGAAPVAIAGRLDPLAADPAVDLKVDLRGVDLRPLSPYSGRYAGYELVRGRMTLDARATLAGRQLDTENVVTLEDFTFGAATNSPEATALPVRLGLALLKDARGIAVIDLPVKGNLEDPEFSVRRVAGRVLGNLLTKAATSPFALLGSLVGGAGDELAWQEFAPGESALTEAGARKLDALAQALRERPTLTLALTGGSAPAADADALRRKKLAASLEAARRQQAAAPPAAPVDGTVADAPAPEAAADPEAEFAATVKYVFDRKFPPGSELGTPLPPAPPILAPPPPDEDRHWVRRVYDWVTLKERRERFLFRKEQEEIQRLYLEQAKVVVDAGLPVDVMLERLAGAEKVDPDELTALASARLGAIRDRLVERGIGLERLALEDPTLEAAAGGEPGAAPRVTLELR